jgi:hypothetical protein
VAENVDVILNLQQQREFVQGADEASKAIKGVGEAAETSGKKQATAAQKIAGWAASSAAVYKTTEYLKDSVSTTTELTKSALGLTRATGMEVEESGKWAATLKARGIEQSVFSKGMLKLSREMSKSSAGTRKAAVETAKLGAEYDAIKQKGGKDAPDALKKLQTQIDAQTKKGATATEMWDQLGVSMDDVKAGNMGQVIYDVSDALAKIESPADKAAISTKLFGRAGEKLSPLLYKGSDALKEQLELQGKYVNITEDSAKTVKDLAANQRELKAASMGLQVSIGNMLLPVLATMVGWVTKLAGLLQPFIKNGKVGAAVVVAIAAGFTLWATALAITAARTVISTAALVAHKVATLAVRGATLLATAAQWLFNVAMTANPIGLVIVAIGALIAIIVLLVKHWDSVTAAVQWCWDKIKQFASAAVDAMKGVLDWMAANWPKLLVILTGPFGLAIAAIVKYFDQIKAAAGAAIDWIKAKIDGLFSAISEIPGKIGGALDKIPGVKGAKKVVGKAKSAVGLATGGVTTSAGTALVGERGPELLVLPAAASVIPLQGSSGFGGGPGVMEVRVPVFLDRRQIAEAVGSFTTDAVARR